MEQSPSRLLQVRGKLYELLVNCIPADVIFKTLLKELIPKVSEGLAHELTHWAAHYEHTLVQGSKEVFHLEAFVAKCKLHAVCSVRSMTFLTPLNPFAAMQLVKKYATEAMTGAAASGQGGL